MSIIETIKRILPPSSRSFHAFREAEENRYRDMLQKLTNQMNALAKAQSDTKAELSELRKSLDAHDSTIKFFEWELYRRSGETAAEAKKRFFKSLPCAEGSKRLIQRGSVKLLAAFNKICEENQLSYYAGGGTLIGAVRHGGFIPWDDDIDLVMMRDEFDRLREVVSNYPDYRLSIVYDPFVLCRQIRFMFKEEEIPCFLDIFPFDFAREDAAKDVLPGLRNQLVAQLASSEFYSKWLERGCVDESDPIAKDVAEAIGGSLTVAQQRGVISSRSEGKYVVRGIDNFDDPNGYHWSAPVSEILPLCWVPFDETTIAIPANYETFLAGAYGDIYALPKDIYTHFDHIAGQVSDYSAMERSLEAKLRELNELR